MNLVGHVHVALARGAGDPEVWLGAMVPDLAHEAGASVGDLDRWSPAAAEGVRWHRATDAAFHAAPPFLAGVRRLREDLRAAGLGTGPARAVAHAGWELLLDGALVGHRPTVDAYLAALDVPAARFGAGLPEGERARWSSALVRRRAAGPPVLYADAGRVAALLQRILARRRALAFAAAEVDGVAAVLASHQPSVEAAAADVVTAAGSW
ncbi:MAG TPA: hypothetical protein VGB14_00120 [Acidimicrobiales bacterium]